ncbi:MAG: c-type cytochrome [Bacteroidia bacterium]|nr:c-type cytochrome [Bacteroidia bacterium]
MKKAPFILFFLSLCLLWSCSGKHQATPYDFNIPQGYPKPIEPSDNLTTVEGVKLGRKLFYDKRLSRDNTQSCGSCHQQEHGFSDPARFSKGIKGQEGHRQSMTLINLAYNPYQRFFWDGRAESLEQQAFEPVRNPIEMDNTWPEVVKRIRADKEYLNLFDEAFGTRKIDSTLVTKALAQFMRTLISFDSRFDKYVRGELNLTPSEFNGYNLIQSQVKGDCFHCHNAEDKLFTGMRLLNNGLDPESQWTDMGYYNVTKNPADKAKFKTPTLRNIMVSGPYMHDGRFNTVKDVIEQHYFFGGNMSSTIDPNMEYVNQGLDLSATDIQDIITFLHTLTDDSFLTDPEFSDPN